MLKEPCRMSPAPRRKYGELARHRATGGRPQTRGVRDAAGERLLWGAGVGSETVITSTAKWSWGRRAARWADTWPICLTVGIQIGGKWPEGSGGLGKEGVEGQL